jgi:hypothetical protein
MRYILVPLVALDVLVNVVLCLIGAICTLDASMVQDSYKHTLSARAGHMAQEGKPWGLFFAPLIDDIFGDGHCKAQWERESKSGSVWASLNQPSA